MHNVLSSVLIDNSVAYTVKNYSSKFEIYFEVCAMMLFVIFYGKTSITHFTPDGKRQFEFALYFILNKTVAWTKIIFTISYLIKY